MAENEKYLASIQGRIDLFKNELQTLWTHMLDSDAIKFFVDLGTALLKLVDTMGAIPTAAGVFAAWKFAAKELKEAFNTTSVSTKTLKTKLIEYLDKQNEATAATNEATAATATNTAAQEENAIATQDAAAQNVVKEQSSNNSAQAEMNDAAASQLSRESDQMQGQMSLYSAECNDVEAQSAERARQAELGESESSQLSRESDQMQGQMSWSNLFNGNVPTMHVGGNGTPQSTPDSKNIGIFATMLGKLGSGAAKAGKAIKALSIGLGKGLLVMGAIKVATWALGKAWDWLDKNIINRAEHIKEEVEELQKTYKEAKKTFDDNLTSLTTSSDAKTYATLADEFAVLTKGVDQYGNNISLTSDQYERYKEICEKIVGIQPSIAAGYDSATKAIGNNANALAQLIELQKYQQSQTVDELISDENLGKIAENAVNNLEATKDEGENDELKTKFNDFWSPLSKAVTGKDHWELSPDTSEYILTQLGYTAEEIDNIILKHFTTGIDGNYFDQLSFINDYYDEIVANVDKFSPEIQQIIKDGAAKVEKTILAADEDIEAAQNKLVDTFLQVPYGSDARPYYDQLDDASQKFITEWIKNSSQFKVDANKTGEAMEKSVEKITNMVWYLVSDDFKNQEITLKSGEQITGQDILDRFYNLDPSTVNWADYKTQKQALLDAFWEAIGGKDNKFGITQDDLKVSFGIEFIDDTDTNNQKATEIKSQVAEKLGVTVDELQAWLDQQPASRVQAFYEIKWNNVGEIKSFGDINKLIDNKIPKIVQASGNTFSNYKSTVEDLTGAQSIQNEVIYDNMQLTEEQGETLKTLIGDEADYADAIDSTNGYVVKDAALLNKLISKKKQEATQNVRTERTQARLQYYELYKRIRQLTGVQGQLAKANAQEINALYKEMGAVEKTIAKYSLLEQKLLGAADAYQKYEDAKAADEAKDYGSKAEEMMSGLIEGLQSAKLGTESFQAAVLGMVPPEVYANLDTVEEKVAAIVDYLKNSNFSRYFTLEFEDDGTLKSAEMTLDNVKAFIEDGLNGVNGGKPVFVGEDWQHFELSDDIKTLDDFCKAMNLTKEMAFALFTEIDSYDAEWLNGDFGSIFDQLDLGLEGNIFMVTKTLTELDVALANNEITVDEWATKYQEANAKLQGCAEDARKNAIAYQEASENVDDLKGKLEEATQKLNQMNQPNSGATQDEIDAQTKLVGELTTQLGEALQKKYNLEEPTELSLQLASDDIDAQMDAWRTRNKNLAIKANIDDIDDSELVELGEDGKYKIKPGVELSENEKTELQKYIDLLNDKGVINLLIEGDEDAKAQIEEVKTAAEAAKKAIEALPDPSIDSTSAITQINNLISAIDRIPTGVTITTTYREVSENENVTKHTPRSRYEINSTMADGTAHASGDWGLKQNETGSLIGELGPETLVRDGKWQTIGDNGAEIMNLKRGDIIFNHLQTKQLLKNGHINSRGKMVGGQSFAEGNAHVTIDTNYTTPTYYDAADSLSDAADDLSDAANDFEKMFDWFEVLIEEIDQDLSYLAAALENAVGVDAKNNIQDQMININKLKLTELGEGYQLYADYAAELLAKVPEQYRDLAQQGGVALTRFLGEANQEVVEAINNYREWADKAENIRTQQQEINKEIASLALQKVQTINDEYDRQITLLTARNDLLQANIDLLEEEGNRVSAVMYEEQIQNTQKELELLQKKREEMQKEFDAQVSAGNIEVNSEKWYEGISAIQEVDKAIIECNTDIEGFQNSINQLHWDNFEKIIEAIDNVGEEISNLRDLIDEEDIADEFGNWTDKGITAMGLLAQEMERAKYRSQQYADEIQYLNQAYAAGEYSTDEYNEKLQELKKGQFDSIKAYEDAKDALVDLNKTRVQAAKDAMQKEIDAYSELIDKKKEELSLQKEAHDFSKEVAEQQKNIATIQKQLAALAGDNSASAIARRKQLEAQLAEAQADLDETYYNHSIEQQQDALDKQAENYQDEKDKEMEALDEYLKNVEQVIADSFATITGNPEAVAGTLKEIADEYGINLSDAITSPWEQGANAIGTYQDQLDLSTSAFIEQLQLIKQQLLDTQAEADETAQHLVDAINQQADDTTSANYVPPESPTPPGDGNQPEPKKPDAPATGSSVTVKKSATNFSRDGGSGTKMQSWVPGSTFTVYQVSGSEVLIGRNGQYTGWVKLSDIEGYAKGSKKIPKDQLAFVDELGDELQLVPGKNGRLEYIKKGTGILPSDLTEKLMNLAIDPSGVLERAMPKIGLPYITNNNMEINLNIAEVVHIDRADNRSIPDITKAVQDQMDSYMKRVNQGLKRYTR